MSRVRTGEGPGRRKARDGGVDLVPGGLEGEASRVKRRDPIEDELGFVLVQFSNLQGHNPALRVGEHAEGEHRVHPEGGGGFKSPAVTEEDRVGHAPIGSVLSHRIAKIDGNADNFKSFSRMFDA